MTTLDELEGSVERVSKEARFAAESGLSWAMLRPDDLRLLLSERAELLAAVERMRGALEKIKNRTNPHPDDTVSDTAKDALKANHIARAALTTGEEK